MQTPRTYSWTFKSATALLVTQVALCVPLYVNAAATSGVASVRVLAQPTALGTLSIFEVSVAGAQPSARTINAKPQNVVRSTLAQFSGAEDMIQPAVFSIAGLPTQTFAIVMPSPGSSATPNGTVAFSDFVHNAGGTPTIGVSGSSLFSVGARMRFMPSSGISVTQPQAQTQDKPNQTPAQKAGLPSVNPFGVQGVQDGFMNVLVSYN